MEFFFEKKKKTQLKQSNTTTQQRRATMTMLETNEPEISTFYSAIPVENIGPNNPEVPIGTPLLYKTCQKKCDLPDGATTWKCPDCHSVPAECVCACCTIQ